MNTNIYFLKKIIYYLTFGIPLLFTSLAMAQTVCPADPDEIRTPCNGVFELDGDSQTHNWPITGDGTFPDFDDVYWDVVKEQPGATVTDKELAAESNMFNIVYWPFTTGYTDSYIDVFQWDDFRDLLGDPSSFLPDPTTAGPGMKDENPITLWHCVPSNNLGAKFDLRQTYLSFYQLDHGDPYPHLTMMGGGIRDSNNGSAAIGFWLFQGEVSCDQDLGIFVDGEGNPAEHHDGDTLLVSDFTAGGRVANIHAWRWTGDDATGAPVPLVLPSGQTFGDCMDPIEDDVMVMCGTVNPDLITPAWHPHSTTSGRDLDTGQFFEGGVDLTELTGIGVDICVNSFIMETRASHKIDAKLHDFVGGKLSTCGKIIVRKTTDPEDEPTLFGFNVTDDDSYLETFALADMEEKHLLSLLPGSYTVSENTPPTDWTLDEAFCALDIDRNEELDLDELADSFDPRDVPVAVGFNELYICYFHNVKKARLTLEKTVINDNGGSAVEGDFQANISGTGAPGDVDWDAPQVLNAGSYSISESTLAGYSPSNWTCDNDDSGAYDGTTVTLEPGDDVVCIIENDDNPPSLKLIKHVISNNGGTADASDWNVCADATCITGSETAVEVTDQVGTYVLSENTTELGYSLTSLSCTDDSGTSIGSPSVTVSLGEIVTCTFVNNDDPPSLKLIKHVISDNGGTADASDWNVCADATCITGSETAVEVTDQAGTYGLSENTTELGYSLTSLSCTDDSGTSIGSPSVTVSLGEIVTCTFVNNDISPTLTIRKFVVNGDHDADHFVVRTSHHDLVFDTGTPSGVNTMLYEAETLNDLLANHAYGLMEDNVDFYQEGTWSCDGNHGVGGGGSFDSSTVTLDLDEDVICWITNVGQFEADLVKLFNGVPNPLIEQWFEIYMGPDGFGGTLVEKDSTLGVTNGELVFNDVKLMTTKTYTFCEREIPAGWSADWFIDDGDTKGVLDINDTLIVPYNPDADEDPPEDVGNRCIDFGAGTSHLLKAGETLSLIIDNTPPPGDTRTPGYWKNWSSCTNGNQFDKAKNEFFDGIAPRLHYSLDELLAHEIWIGELSLINSNGAPTTDPLTYPAATLEECQAAVNVLNSSDQSAMRGKKPLNRSSDAAYKLARSLFAYKLNILAGAGSCAFVDQTAIAAQCLLRTGEETGCPFDGSWVIDGIEWDGEGSYLGPKDGADPAIVDMALTFHGILDDYNNFGCD